VLLFVDVTNEYTYDRARLMADQMGVYNNQKTLALHLIESKVETVEKDALKRKVSKRMLRKIADQFQGGVFQYRQNQSVEPIIQEVLEWKQNGKEIALRQRQMEK
jgi:hypothetical protein